jgi:methionyl-tRNA formyltransferase
MPGAKKLDKIVFFGTPDFALPTLAALDAAGLRPQRVVTQPARPAGRGQAPQEPPVAVWAREHGCEVLQPERVRDPDFLAAMAAARPDVAVVVAFGQIFPQELLDLPRHGCINLHASLLPKYRGAAPIQTALAEGQKRTGVTTMLMEEELDSGPILLQEETDIGPTETAGRLSERLAAIGAELLVKTLQGLAKGKLTPKKQRDDQATYAGRLSKRDGKANWALEAPDLYNRLRALTPWPGMAAHFRGRPVRIVWGVPVDWEEVPVGSVGTYVGMRQGRLAVLCGSGTLFGLERLQRSGKKAVSAADFANGERLRVGERFA